MSHVRDDAREVIQAALRAGPWPARELSLLVADATGSSASTVQRAARELHDAGLLHVGRRVFWADFPGGQIPYYIAPYTRERLIATLVNRRDPIVTPYEAAREEMADEWRELVEGNGP